MALPVVTSYQFISRTGGIEIMQWILDCSEMGFELKSFVFSPENKAGALTAMMQRPLRIVDGTDGWSYPDQEG